ncbi:uncharacterized protein METZ01_LOCUS182608, partial [marine metagenome]
PPLTMHPINPTHQKVKALSNSV